MPKFYITTTIPYVNAEPHIGHALEFVQADVIARYFIKQHGKENVYFLSGTDENAIKNVRAAEEAGIPVKDFVDKNSAIFKNLLKRLNIDNDQFIRTTEKRHTKGAQALWLATKKEDISKKKSYKGLYCVGCEQFYKPEELDKSGFCHEHPGKKLEEIEEKNYFFKLSNYQDWLVDLIGKGQLKIIPEKRKNEVLAFIKRGLGDFSISRSIKRSKGWGVPVPGDDEQTMYVWYDALSNYITALGYPDKSADLYKKFWLENDNKIHVLGKGVSRFHAIYWPAMLKSAGLPLPNLEFIHDYITIDGKKISKTLGNTVDPIKLIKKYGVDAVRYYLLREISPFKDGDFNQQRFEELYNADLANGLGNFAARVGALAKSAKVLKPVQDDIDEGVVNFINLTEKAVTQKMEEYKLNEVLESIWELIRFGDGYLNQNKPWTSGDKEVIANALAILEKIGELLEPFLPETAEKIKKGEVDKLFPRLK